MHFDRDKNAALYFGLSSGGSGKKINSLTTVQLRSSRVNKNCLALWRSSKAKGF
jgi:hypothetical protein